MTFLEGKCHITFISRSSDGKINVSNVLAERKSRESEIDFSQEISVEDFGEKNRDKTIAILQAVLYITHSDNELIEEVNQFSKKMSKLETQSKIYSELPFVRVGFNFQLPKNFSDSGPFLVSGHFRWQPHGTKRSLLKLIYIEPFLKRS